MMDGRKEILMVNTIQESKKLNSGWVSIHRKIRENPVWNDGKFSKGQALIDLILSANHKKGVVIVNRKKVVIERGQFMCSQQGLAESWNWSKASVQRFLVNRKKDGFLNLETNRNIQHGFTLVTINKYDEYQRGESQDESQKESQGDFVVVTNNNDINNELNNNNGEQASPDDLEEPEKGSIAETLKAKQKQLTEKQGKPAVGITKRWQDTAFRFAEALKIKLTDPDLKKRWLKLFKDAEYKPELNRKINTAYGFLIDYRPFTDLQGDEARIKYFFWKVNN